jgi:hypothetical protein
MALLLTFLLLQLCDAGTTLIFLGRGISEGNPLIAALLRVSNPELALALVKAVACALGLIAWRSHRLAFLRRANVFFALCVGWNLVAISVR